MTLDTTRVDALSPYGGPPTPAIERLAGEGVLFERAHTPAPLTLPAHATLFSGLYPLRHGVRENGRGALPPEAPTLAEAARAGGFQTAAVVGAVVLDPAFGLDQGFEHYDAPRREKDGPQATGPHAPEAERPAREVVDRALDWLRSRERSRPFFLWVHVYDPHTPYEPPPEFRGGNLRENYQGEVGSVDRELGRLFDALRAERTLDDTLVLVVADHGEGLGEHGEEGHGVFGYQATLHVPFVVRAPFWTRLEPGTRCDELVGLADVLPTVCEALGLELPAGPGGELDGRSFWSASAPAERGLYFESYYGYLNFGWSPLAGWIASDGKYLHTSAPRYYELSADPREERDLLAARQDAARRAQEAIAELAAKPALASQTGAGGEDLLEALRGLGYAGSGGTPAELPHPLADTGLPDPDSMLEPYRTSLRALELGKQGELAEAERLFRSVLAVNPRNPFVLDQLAVCLLQAGRWTEAEETLRSLLELAPEIPGTWSKLAACLEQQGRAEEALEAAEHARELRGRE